MHLKGKIMNFSKKLFLVLGLAIAVTGIEAGQKKSDGLGKPKKNEMISVEQLQQMQEMEQFFETVRVEMAIAFIKKYPKFIISLKSAYKNDSSVVEQKLVEHCEKYVQENAETFLKSMLKDIQATKELQEMIKQVKPFLAPMLAQEIIKWIHITIMAETV